MKIQEREAPAGSECIISGSIDVGPTGTYSETSRYKMDCLIQSSAAVLNMGRLQLLDEREILSADAALLAVVEESDSGDMLDPEPFARLCESLDSISEFLRRPEMLAAPHARRKTFNAYSRIAGELIKNYPEGVELIARCPQSRQDRTYRLQCEKEALERAAESHNTLSAPSPERSVATVNEVTQDGLALTDRPLGQAASEEVKNRLIANLGKPVVLLIDPRLEPVRYWLPTIIDVIGADEEDDNE